MWKLMYITALFLFIFFLLYQIVSSVSKGGVQLEQTSHKHSVLTGIYYVETTVMVNNFMGVPQTLELDLYAFVPVSKIDSAKTAQYDSAYVVYRRAKNVFQ